MSLLAFLLLLLIAGLCGALAEAIVGFSPGGLLVSIAVGLVGAYLGMWLAPKLGLPSLLVLSVEGSPPIDIVWTVLGSLILLLILSLFRGGLHRRGHSYRHRY